MKSFLTIVCLSMAVVAISGQDITECLRQDSISCVQKSLYRHAKNFFGKDNLEIVNGLSLVKSADRGSRTGNEVFYDQEIEAASNVADRQSALENFVGEEVSDFLTGRSLRINFAPAVQKMGESARAMVASVPQEVQQAADATSEIFEGRGKKKLIKQILPLLIAAKVKIGVLATLAYFGIALLAKKALIASVLSIIFSAFVGLRSLWSKGASHDVTGYNAGGWSNGNSGGWSAPASSGGWSSGGGWEDGHAGYASAQSQAFSGYHH
ncbi:uncharacterized protein Osi6 [Fopius arisanus]|uniref:Uncharacterized protein Osi6 n=1 Tax=Fopius arisanus TaxID=64838 RepID=A0A0C9QCT0_9HYME|nr:PREDICTED: uncharacterized protein LOC105273674 [Fopius arisanus]